MSRMESILHPIFCLFLYFKLVATFDGNFSSNGIWHFLLCQAFSFLSLFWVGDLLLQGINCMSSMMVGFTSHLQNNFEFFGLLWKSRDSKIYFCNTNTKGVFKREQLKLALLRTMSCRSFRICQKVIKQRSLTHKSSKSNITVTKSNLSWKGNLVQKSNSS